MHPPPAPSVPAKAPPHSAARQPERTECARYLKTEYECQPGARSCHTEGMPAVSTAKPEPEYRHSPIHCKAMTPLSRRSLLTAPLAPFILAKPSQVEVKIEEIRSETEDYTYRTPIKFGGNVVDRVTVLNVHVKIRTAGGRVQAGFGSMPLGNIWAFPSRTMNYGRTLNAMRVLCQRIEKITNGYKELGHPCDINVALEPLYLQAADEVTKELKLDAPIPKLCTLVAASPYDAAVHDAYGKLLKRSSYAIYGPDCMRHDIAHYLGDKKFAGEYLQKYVLTKPKPSLPMYHLVGALDPIYASDIKEKINDGLPETLGEWIPYNGLTNLKIKLNGDDLKWDVERVLIVERAASEAQAKRGQKDWVYSLDFNERCPNVGYLMDVLQQIKQKSPEAFRRVQYVEQPTARDLKANRQNVMHEVAKLKPVVIDESLTDYESLVLSREMGYSGVALKACKGQTQALLMGAAALKDKLFLCVQDLTCPGASLIHSAGLSAHVPTVAGIECNSRQYCPVANKGWAERFPGLFVVKDGRMKTSEIKGPGLGAVA